MQSEWLTAPEAARRLGVTGQAVRDWARSGRLPAERLGNGMVLFRAADVEVLRQRREWQRGRTGTDPLAVEMTSEPAKGITLRPGSRQMTEALARSARLRRVESKPVQHAGDRTPEDAAAVADAVAGIEELVVEPERARRHGEPSGHPGPGGRRRDRGSEVRGG